jgi:hypothetical protein
MSGAQARATATQVSMVIDEVRRIAHKTMGDLTDKAGHHRSTFGSAAKLDHGVFGQVEKAQHFATHQEAARQVFVDTYQGVIKDLETFRENLLACAEAHEANDESVQAGLLALSNRIDSHALASTRENKASREKHGAQLGQGGPLRASAAPDAAGDPAGAAATPVTADPSTDTQTSTQAGGAAHADAPTPHSYS